MKNIILLLILLSTIGFAKNIERRARNNWDIKTAFVTGNYQDVSMATMRFVPVGTKLDFDWIHLFPQKSELSIGVAGGYNKYHSTSNDISEFNNFMVSFKMGYLYKHTIKDDFSLFYGISTEINTNLYINPELENNGTFGVFENPFFLTIKTENTFSENKKLRCSFSLAPIGFVDKLIGYAFSVQQSILENGSFDYTHDLEDLGYKNAEFMTIGSNYVRMATEFTFQFHSHWSTSYRWDLLKFNYKDWEYYYPLVSGTHNFSINFLF